MTNFYQNLGMLFPYEPRSSLKSFPHAWKGEYAAQIRKFFTEQEEIMSNGKKSPAKPFNYAEVEFVQHKLNAEEKVQFTSWGSGKNFDSDLEVSDFIQHGWKVSVSWDMNNDCYIVAATCKDEKSVNVNKCITSRSDQWFEALLMNVFKVTVLFKGQALSTAPKDDSWG
jgi:hypothetical protein